MILTLLAGFAAWSLAEYLVHRFVLHLFKPFRSGHMLHHRDPHAKVGVPFEAAALIFLFAFLIAASIGAVAFVAGCGIGYLLYVTLHEGLHRWEPLPAWARPLHRWHELHHRGFAANYGVTSPLWDIVFGTFRGFR